MDRPELKIFSKHTQKTVSDALVSAIYGPDLADVIAAPDIITKLYPHARRRLDFYLGETGMGAEFSAATLKARLFIADNLASGYVSSFEAPHDFGILHKFNRAGLIERFPGHWAKDAATGQELFTPIDGLSQNHYQTTQNEQEASERLSHLKRFFQLMFLDKIPS